MSEGQISFALNEYSCSPFFCHRKLSLRYKAMAKMSCEEKTLDGFGVFWFGFFPYGSRVKVQVEYRQK